MNKSQLIERVAEKAGMTKAEAGRAVDVVVASVEEALAQGGSVHLVGFGTFSVTERAAREGRNPATGDKIQIESSKSVRFKQGKGLKDRLNG